jgi:mRNA interferase RelE/StbE
MRADYDQRAISQAAAFLDDPPGIRAALDVTGQLADDPRPDGSFPYGSPDLRRLRAGRYRVLYEISEDAPAIRHIARGSLQTACGHASWHRVSPAPGRLAMEPSQDVAVPGKSRSYIRLIGTWWRRRLTHAEPNRVFCIRPLAQPNGPANDLICRNEYVG